MVWKLSKEGYRKDENENLRKFAKAANVANTLNGGMAKPQVTFSKEEDHYHIALRMASTDEGSFKVEIINQALYIFLLVDESEMKNPRMRFPIEIMPIPLDVDFHNISAHYERGILNVVMPFNELANGYRQGIEIMR